MSYIKDILWIGPWSSEHNNCRLAELLPRLTRIDALKIITFSANRYIRSIQYRAYRRVLPIFYPLIFRLLSKRYKYMWCTDLNQIPYFEGDIVVDVDDPCFTSDEILMLNHPHVRAVVTTTHFLRERLMKEGLQKEVFIIPQGISFKDKSIKRQTDIARRYRGCDKVVIGLSQPLLSLGIPADKSDRGNWPYDLKFLMDAMEIVWSAIPGAVLWLLGQPHKSLIEFARRRPFIRLMGYVPHTDLLNYVANFDIAVYPRQIDFGGRFSIKLIEYLGCGVPVVSTNVTESFIVSEARAGIIANDVKQFADALIQLARDPVLRRELGENGRRFAANYDWDILAVQYEQKVFKHCFGPR